MSDEKDNERGVFFAALKEMEHQAQQCNNKTKFLDNVLMAKEQITFSVIDRCREAALQLRQYHYAVKTNHKRLIDTALGVDNKAHLDELLKAANEANNAATAALNEIVSWANAMVSVR